MSHGLQVWDAAGNLVLGLGDRIPRVVDSWASGAVSGSRSVPALAGGTPWSFMVALGVVSSGVSLPILSISGATVTWTYPSGATPIACLIYVGLY